MKKIIETDRTFFREMDANDFDDLCKILQNIDVMYAYEHSFTEEEVWNWLNKNIERYNKNGHGLWAVIQKETNIFLGQCGLTIQETDGKEYLEIGYLFKKDYWHKGYAAESAIECKEYAFKILNSKNVYSIIRRNNIASQKVAERVGMKIINTIVKHYYNIDMPHYIYEIKNMETK
ncbi:MAG: GNAT family N-acetyltransferase [Treponema sp.]|jgi:RimJ/RimL family protein N-acetyltransferase|nr:GNAT family N-acetyltransferase [Treponema sp.]